MKKLFVIGCLCLAVCRIGAQNISGRLVDEKRTAVGYVNVVLQTTDSVFVTGTTSDEKGAFALTAPKAASYLVQLSSIGYETQVIRIDDLVKNRNLGTIVMTEASAMLGEVSVTASATVKKVDRQIVYPSEKQLKLSTSGYDLLARLMLPDLQVDPIQNTISTLNGGSVEVRINDVKATHAQVSALRPSEVVRVEYIDNPGVRYGDTNVGAVINYIVRRRTNGISGGIEGMNAVTTGFGNDNVYLKANSGKSEFGVDYFISYRNYDDRYSEGYDRFSMPDGTSHRRTLEPVSVPFGYTQQTIEASYNLTEPDKYVLNILFTDEIMGTGKQDFAQRIIETGQPDLTFFKHGEDHSNTPSLDVYYSLNLPRKQKLTANVVGTYIGTDYVYDYREYEVPEETLSHYAYSTDGKRYSLIGEAIYSKEWDKVVLSAGVKGNTAYTKNVYTGSEGKALHMHNSSLYGYLQLQGQWKKLNYMVGAGLMRQAFSESDNSFTYYTFRPSVSLSVPLLKNTQLRYSFSINPSTPSLSQLSDVTQQNNNLELTRGNRDLDPYRGYNNQLTFSWNTKRVNTQLTGSYYYYDSPIMTSIRPVQDDGGQYLLEYAYENGKSHQSAGGRLNVQWKIIPDVLNISAYGAVNWYRSEGADFSNEYTSWRGGVTLSAYYKQFALMAGASTRPKSLYGYYINYGEQNSYVQLTYTYKTLTVGAACLYPFTPQGWTGGSRVTGSPYVEKKSWTHIKDNGNMFCLYFNWKFNSGRKYQGGRKTMNNKDSDSGIVK